MDYVVREAGPDDAATICGLIRELAAYERLADEAEPDAEALAGHLDDRSGPVCHALLAEVAAGGARGADAIGFALYFSTYSTFLTRPGIWLEDIFVKPDHRRLGVGLRLIREVARRAVSDGCCRMEWSVLDWNEPAIRFYQRIGARRMDDWRTMRLAGSGLADLARGDAV